MKYLKYNKIHKRPILKIYEKKLQQTKINGKINHVHHLEDSILLLGQFPSNLYIGFMKSQSKLKAF